MIDHVGYLLVRGRDADRRLVGAQSLFPVDIAEALCAHPEFRYAVAVPAPDSVVAVFGAVPVTEQGEPNRP